jgi:hypothetical protein
MLPASSAEVTHDPGRQARSVDKVAALEVQLGIDDLKQFTPRG